MSDLDYHEVTKEDWSFGEIAPSFQGRVSSNEYKQGSALMYNVLPRSGGGWRRRPGTRFIATITCDSGKLRMFDFTAQYGQQFCIVLCVVSGTPTVYVYSLATRAIVGTAITASVSAFGVNDLASISYTQNAGIGEVGSSKGQTWFFLRSGTDHPHGMNPFYVTNANADGSGAFTCVQPTFVNADTGGTKFDTDDNYPACGEFYGGRFYAQSTNNDPGATWGSILPVPGATAPGYLTLTVGVTVPPAVTSGIFYRGAAMNDAGSRWLFSSQSLLCATDRSIFMYPDGLSGVAPTPSSFWLKKSASYGGMIGTRPVQVQNVCLYLGSDAKSFRSLILSMQRGYFADGDLSEQAEHLMARKAVDFRVLMKPDPTAFILMSDGTLVSATVKQEDSGFIVKAGCGFAQHALGGSGSVVAMCQLTNTYWDELWMAVNRAGTVDIEYLYLDDINSTTQAQSFYVDCGMTQTGPATHWAGLPSPLGSQIVAALGDGKVMPLVTCNPAAYVDYTFSVTTLNVGFPYYSAWQDLRPLIPAKGATLGLLRKIEKSWLLLMNSLGGWIGQTAPADPLNHPETTLVNFWPAIQKYGIQKYGNPPTWANGIIPIEDSGDTTPDGQVYIAIVDPVPFNLVGITTRFALSEV